MTKYIGMLERQNTYQARQRVKTNDQKVISSSQVPISKHLGNRAIQRLLAQRTGDGAFDLDDATANRINQARGSGQALDGAIQKQMSESMGADFSNVRVHTGSESHALNKQLNAKAFTTGSDIFFRHDAYSPQSNSGQELIAHELTHVVQQGSGAVGNGGGQMKVNAPGDRFEQEADSVSKAVVSTPSAQAAAPTAQRQEMDKDVYTKRLQRATPDDDNMVRKAELPKEEQTTAAPSMPESTTQEEKLT